MATDTDTGVIVRFTDEIVELPAICPQGTRKGKSCGKASHFIVATSDGPFVPQPRCDKHLHVWVERLLSTYGGSVEVFPVGDAPLHEQWLPERETTIGRVRYVPAS